MGGRARHRKGQAVTASYFCIGSECAHTVSADRAEDVVMGTVRAMLADRVAEIRTSQPAVDAAAIQKRIEEAADARFLTGELSPEQWKRIDSQLRHELEAITISTKSEMAPAVFEKLWKKADLMGKRELLSRFISTIVIKPAARRGRVFDQDRVVVYRAGIPQDQILDQLAQQR